VAALAALQAIENGFQVAIMAPTKSSAEQHFNKFSGWLTALGVSVVWLAVTRAQTKARDIGAGAAGDAQIAIGTHALFQDEVEFRNLGLAIVDEQHRFGVHQRLALRRKGTRAGSAAQPHQLMLSATPDSAHPGDELLRRSRRVGDRRNAPGRTPVATRLVSDARRDEVIKRRARRLHRRQPGVLGVSINRGLEALQLQTALEPTSVAGDFSRAQGRAGARPAPAAEKAAVMQAFQSGEIQLLVATTVIEVGVDVPTRR